MNKLEIKDENGKALVRVQGKAGQWGRPIITDEGRVYQNARLAAEDMLVSIPSINNAIKLGTKIKNRKFRYASVDEVEKSHMFSDSDTEAISTPAAMASAANNKIFTVTIQSDGKATVRMGSWSMTRSSLSDIPVEILRACEF